MASIRDRFKQLRDAILRIFQGGESKRDLRREAIEYGMYMRTRLQANAPDGSKWVEPRAVFQKRERFPVQRSARPSLRQHGITLADSFALPELGSETNLSGQNPTVEVEITSSAPHAQVVIEGASPHIIPSNIGLRKLFFYSHRDGAVRFMAGVSHKGHQRNPFVEETMLKERSTTEKRFDAFIARTVFKPLENLFE